MAIFLPHVLVIGKFKSELYDNMVSIENISVGTVGEPSYMDLSNMPVDNKQQQTMMWQQNQYMSDSGIHSGQTTQVNYSVKNKRCD